MKITVVLASNLTLAKGYTPKQRERVGKINDAIKAIKAKFKELFKKKSALLKAALPLKKAYRKTLMRGAPDKKISAKLQKLMAQINTINERTRIGRGKISDLNKKLRGLRRAAGYKSGMTIKKKRKKLPPIPTNNSPNYRTRLVKDRSSNDQKTDKQVKSEATNPVVAEKLLKHENLRLPLMLSGGQNKARRAAWRDFQRNHGVAFDGMNVYGLQVTPETKKGIQEIFGPKAKLLKTSDSNRIAIRIV